MRARNPGVQSQFCERIGLIEGLESRSVQVRYEVIDLE